MYGGDGADTIYGRNLSDYLHGWGKTLQDVTVVTDLDYQSATGLNVQRIYGNGGADWIQGGPADEYLYGDSDTGDSSWSDKIGGGAGNDVIFGDSQYGNGSGADNIDGGEGSDTIYGDTMYGTGSGGDEIAGSGGSDVIYADSRLGSGTGDDEVDAGDGADIVYGDSYSGSGSGRDRLYGGSGGDLIFGDSMTGAGSGRDYLFGDEDGDQLYGDSYLAQGSGNDVVVGGSGSDLLVGDSYLSAGTGLDLLDGGMDNDLVYGDSVEGRGSGSDIAYGGEGDDLVAGDSAKADGSGHDWLDGGAGTDTMHGDTELGENLGHDLLIRGEAGEAAVGQAKPGDTAIPDDIQGASYSYDVNGYTAQYSENPDTGEIQAYDYELGKWDTVGERCWDAERSAWVTNMGQVVIGEYVGKTIQYENYGDSAWILENGVWQPYSPDEQYVVDFKEDPVTGELLVYDNDLGTWDPYMREYTPAGKDYTVLNEGDTIFVEHTDESVLRLENYGEGAAINGPATGYQWMNLPGTLAYHDPSSNIWYSHGWGTWSYSIDVGATWKDVPMLDFQIVEDADASEAGTFAAAADTGSVNVFDGHAWFAKPGKLEFLDSRYAQSGWHKIANFYVELYDGIGYDGQPLMVIDGWDADGVTHNSDYEAVLKLPPTGGAGQPPAEDAKITYWQTWIYGEWTNELLFWYEIPNPSPDYRPERVTQPLTMYFQSYDCPGDEGQDMSGNRSYEHVRTSLGTNVLYHRYHDYSLEDLVRDCEVVQYVTSESAQHDIRIQNLMIINHSDNIGELSIGCCSTIMPGNFYETSRLVGYEGHAYWFTRLGNLMASDAQIQYYGCKTAGPDPFDDRTPSDISADAMKARSMLSTIAKLTGATVFASSDDNQFKVIDVNSYEFISPLFSDLCLEFGVSPEGVQVDYTALRSTAYNLEKWAGPLHGVNSIQEWDDDEKSLLIFNWGAPTLGEMAYGTYYYAPLVKTSGR